MFISVDLPAPDGPIIAVNCPDWNFPVTHFNIVFCSVNWFFFFFYYYFDYYIEENYYIFIYFLPFRLSKETLYDKSLNAMSTGGRFGKWLSDAIGLLLFVCSGPVWFWILRDKPPVAFPFVVDAPLLKQLILFFQKL